MFLILNQRHTNQRSAINVNHIIGMYPDGEGRANLELPDDGKLEVKQAWKDILEVLEKSEGIIDFTGGTD